MQFPENELLQLVGSLTLFGVDAGLSKQDLGVNHGLFQQQAKAVVLRREEIPAWAEPPSQLARFWQRLQPPTARLRSR